jgi:aspartate/methionine/tyrosine aminotransferase
LWTLLEPGDEAAIMLPNYLQTWGPARSFADARPFRLRVQNGASLPRLALDVDQLKQAVTRRTKLIIITNPNNPTGTMLTETEVTAVADAARSVGAWLISDEIYRGTELNSTQPCPTFWGRYEKTIITSGLSKAFGLPGLRVGWIVAPPALIGEFWRRHDYLTIMVSTISAELAATALLPSRRDQLLARTKRILQSNLPLLEQWIGAHGTLFRYIRPQAGAVALLGTNLQIPTTEFAERLRVGRSVLVVAGEQLGADPGLRIGYGHDMAKVMKGLERIDSLLREMGAS